MSYLGALDYDVMSVLLKMVPRYAARVGLSITEILSETSLIAKERLGVH